MAGYVERGFDFLGKGSAGVQTYSILDSFVAAGGREILRHCVELLSCVVAYIDSFGGV